VEIFRTREKIRQATKEVQGQMPPWQQPCLLLNFLNCYLFIIFCLFLSSQTLVCPPLKCFCPIMVNYLVATLEKRGSSNADVRTFDAKTSDFSKFMYVQTDKRGGGEPVRTFYGQMGRRLIFRDFVPTSFKDGPLRKILLLLLLLQTTVKYQIRNRFGVFRQLILFRCCYKLKNLI